MSSKLKGRRLVKMDPSQPQPEPITAAGVVPPRPTFEPTTHHSQTTPFPTAVNGGAARSGKRGRGRPRKNQAQPTEPKPVVLGLSEALLTEMEDARRGKLNQGRANGTPPLPPILPAVSSTDSLKKRHERLPKVWVVQSAAPDVHHVVPTKSELTAIGGCPGQLPVKPSGWPKVVADDAAPEYNLDCQVLQKKMEIMRWRIKEAVGVLKPYISTAENPSSSVAMAAILELERIAMDSRPPPLIDLNLHPDS